MWRCHGPGNTLGGGGYLNTPQAARKAYAHKIHMSKEDWKHVARLYTIPLLKGEQLATPDSPNGTYMIARRYIIQDFHRVEFDIDNHTVHRTHQS